MGQESEPAEEKTSSEVTGNQEFTVMLSKRLSLSSFVGSWASVNTGIDC